MKNILKYAFPIILIISLIYGVNMTQNYSHNQDIKRIEETTKRLCLKYYSNEGRYPHDIEELINDYGLRYNQQQYHLIYHNEGDNILPTIKVYRKGKQYE